MIKKVKSMLVIAFLLASTIILFQAPKVKAAVGKANVYIICLSDVGGWWFNPEEVKEGAIKAVKPRFESYDASNIPVIHPKVGTSPPFLSISHEVISDWDAYQQIVESYTDVIIVNTHDEILPVPSGYTRESWADKIAVAMLERHVTWVHVGGYPFYYAWYQGATDKETWNTAGFQQLMQHINKGHVIIPCLSESERACLSTAAEKNLGGSIQGYTGWNSIYETQAVALRRPLLRSDLDDYEILPIWNNSNYYEGMVVAFVKPNEKFNPNTRQGFGVYVHVGTGQTFDADGNPTDADIFCGYAGCAAAVWTATTGFKGVTRSSRYDPGDVNFTIHVTPAITAWNEWEDGGGWEIHIGFFIMGGLKRPYWSSIDIDKISLYVKPEIPSSEDDYDSIEPYRPLACNAYPDFSEQVMEIGGKFSRSMLKTMTFGFSLFDPSQVSKVFSFLWLMSDWAGTLSYTSFNQTKMDVNVNFFVDTYQTSEGYYDIIEFQSTFGVSLKLSAGNREGWRVIPIHWGVKLWPTTPAEFSGPVTGDNIELAVHFSRSEEYTTTVLFDDFEEETWRYERNDLNPDSGYDYWGITSYNYSFDSSPPFPAGNCFWCAGTGDNSIHNKPNLDAGRYDKNMDAYLRMYIDLKPYKTAWLIYCVAVWWICQGDYFELYVKNINGAWTLADSITSTTTKHWRIIPLQNTINSIKFVFKSNNDNDVDIGAFIYYIEIRATIPNDADTNSDAGDTISYATFIGIPPPSFSGYLDDGDWYIINITSSGIWQFTLYPSLNTLFYIELYDMTDQRIAGPAQSILRSLSHGLYKIRLYSDVGFGQYNLITTYPSEGGGGGGRPPKLLGGEFK